MSVTRFTKHDKFLPISVTIILTIFQLVRVIAFIDIYGGIEHDGGWMLSISRSLAETGTYTTMVSTIVDPEVKGAINVDQKFDIQAPDGRIWFFTGNGIGPSSIVPDALILKLFGSDFWVLRAGPLIFYTLFLLLAALILYRLAGLGAIVLFHAFVYFYPHISIFLGYEAMGEVPSMFYVLWAYLAFVTAARQERHRWLYFLIAGLIAGLAINAKLITLWSLSGIYIWAAIIWVVALYRRRVKRSPPPALQSTASETTAVPRGGVRFSELIWLSVGIPVTLVLWELAQMAILTRLAGFEMYLKQAEQRLGFILDDGSGVGLRIHSGPEFFWDKFFLLAEVAHPQRWLTGLVFVAIVAGGLSLIWYWRHQPDRQNLMTPMWIGWFVNTVWFVSLAKTGWPRHIWFGLVLAMLLLSIIAVVYLRLGLGRLRSARYAASRGWVPLVAGLLLLLVIGWGFLAQPYARTYFLPDAIVAYWQEKQVNNKYDASLPWVIIPRSAQAEVVDYIKRMPVEARVYYPGGHKSAEIPPQTGRLQYTFSRRDFVEPHPADIVLIGPSLISPWKDPTKRQDLIALVERECPRPALRNDYYMICPVEANLVRSD
jgi:hypothetical protein